MRCDAQYMHASAGSTRRFFACGDPPSVASRSAYIAQGDNMPVRSSLLPPNVLHPAVRIATALTTLAVFTACSPDQPAPTGPSPQLDVSTTLASSIEALASPGWQATARSLVSAA